MKKTILKKLGLLLLFLLPIFVAFWLFAPERPFLEIIGTQEQLDDVSARIIKVKALTPSSRSSQRPDPRLIAALKDDHPDVRLEAAVALGELGLPYKATREDVVSPEAKQAIPALCEALGDKHGGVRREAALSILRIDPDSIPVFLESPPGKNPKVRLTILRVMGKPHARTLKLEKAACEMLRDDDVLLREAAALALGRISRNPASVRVVILGLLKALDDEAPSVRIGAASSLASIYFNAEIKPDAGLIIPRLIAGLEDTNKDVRYQMARALQAFWEKAENAIPALLRRLKDPAANVRGQAAVALGKIELQPIIVVPALISLLEDKDLSARIAALSSLGRFGPKARAGIPAILKELRSKDAQIREGAAQALRKIDPKTVGKEGFP